MSNIVTIKDLNGHYAVLDMQTIMQQVDPKELSIHGLKVDETLQYLSDFLSDAGEGKGPYELHQVKKMIS